MRPAYCREQKRVGLLLDRLMQAIIDVTVAHDLCDLLSFNAPSPIFNTSMLQV